MNEAKYKNERHVTGGSKLKQCLLSTVTTGSALSMSKQNGGPI
jgi:hypothetical protein